MSRQQTFKGSFVKVDLGDNTLEEQCQLICNGYSIFEYSYYDSWTEYLKDEFYNEYFIVNNKLYKYLKKEEIDSNDSYVNIEKEGEIYSFTTSFHNGGTCLEEMLEEGLNKL